jgi:Flp pilus assembly protein TadD
MSAHSIYMTVNEISVDSEQLRVLLETGYILREAARFDEAEAVFRGVIELMPDSEIPRVGLGTVYLQRGDFAEAEAICKQAFEDHPNSNYARVHYGEALLFGRQREKAEAELLEVVRKDPDSPHARTAQALLDAANIVASTAE